MRFLPSLRGLLPVSNSVPNDSEPGEIFADLASRRPLTLTFPLLDIVTTITMLGLTIFSVQAVSMLR